MKINFIVVSYIRNLKKVVMLWNIKNLILINVFYFDVIVKWYSNKVIIILFKF